MQEDREKSRQAFFRGVLFLTSCVLIGLAANRARRAAVLAAAAL